MSAIDDVITQLAKAIDDIAAEIQQEATDSDVAVADRFRPLADKLTKLAADTAVHPAVVASASASADTTPAATPPPAA